jgi:putative Mg2+ transporter-C (MgtC) family protein
MPLMGLAQAYQVELRLLAQVILAMILGGAIGFEREAKDKPAGLRTHMLVCGAAALLVGLGDVVVQHFDTGLPGRLVQADPIRLIEAIVAGVSFLGAGTIIRHRSERQIEGLTTAAAILFTAAVGVAVALSQTVLALGATMVVLLTLHALPAIERLLQTTSRQATGAE